jgi:transmembrane sensor
MAKRDDQLAALRRQEPPWDDLLERRVLNHLRAAHGRRTARRRRARTWGTLAAAVVVATSLGAWAIGAFDRAEPSTVTPVATGGTVAEPTAVEPTAVEPTAVEPKAAEPLAPPEEEGSVMALADGSRLLLDDGAQVQMQVQTDESTVLEHREGRVRYEVSPDPVRSFVVQAGAYQVQVLGTVFVVEVGSERLRVEVERGTVAVIHGKRVLELDAGEEIELPHREAAESEPLEDPPSKATKRSRRSTVDELLERADAARRSGRPRDAVELLTALVREHPRDPRAASAWFMLGRVQRGLGHHAQAARAFRSAWKADPSPALAEDARAEEAMSWHEAGSIDWAIRAAHAYLERYPSGTHVARIRTIVR